MQLQALNSPADKPVEILLPFTSIAMLSSRWPLAFLNSSLPVWRLPLFLVVQLSLIPLFFMLPFMIRLVQPCRLSSVFA